jgi:predicted aspartyl protease
MAGSRGIDRRGLALSAAALLSGCAGLAPTPIQVNASNAPESAGEPEANLDTGADASQRVTAPVRINGQGPFDFVVDTGANRTVISAELARRLVLPLGEPTNVHGVAGVEPAPTALVELFQADAISMRGMHMPVLSGERLGAAGLLGVDVLHDRRVLMDFRDHRLTIAVEHGGFGEPSPFAVKSAATGQARDMGRRVVVPARYRFGQLIIIAADVVGRGVTAFIDTGSQSTVGNNALRKLALRGRGPLEPKASRMMVPVLSATGQTAEGELGDMPLLRIGGLDIIGLTTVFADLHVFDIWQLQDRPTLMLGMDVLSRFNALELNYGTRQVTFYLAPKTRAG